MTIRFIEQNKTSAPVILSIYVQLRGQIARLLHDHNDEENPADRVSLPNTTKEELVADTSDRDCFPFAPKAYRKVSTFPVGYVHQKIIFNSLLCFALGNSM
jgi:hypothetical protein